MKTEYNFFTAKPNFIEVMSFPTIGKKVYNCVKNRSKKTKNDVGVWNVKYKNTNKTPAVQP